MKILQPMFVVNCDIDIRNSFWNIVTINGEEQSILI